MKLHQLELSKEVSTNQVSSSYSPPGSFMLSTGGVPITVGRTYVLSSTRDVLRSSTSVNNGTLAV